MLAKGLVLRMVIRREWTRDLCRVEEWFCVMIGNLSSST